MSSSHSDDGALSQPAGRIIYQTRQRVQEVRNQYHRERVFGSVSAETHRELATVALQYRDVLAEHAEEQVVREAWRESGVDRLEELVGETRPVEVAGAGDTRNTETVQRPAVLAVSHADIYQATKDLDRLAKELGFAASTRDKTPEEEATMSDLRGLLKARGQTEAMDLLPGGDEDDGDDDGDSE
jgi:hypothetical protein